jgi:hypothetical protein
MVNDIALFSAVSNSIFKYKKKIANTKDVWDEHGINVNRPSIQEICQAK